MQTKIKILRESRGWSQEKLAAMSELSTRTIQRVERGQRVGLESWLALSTVFEMTVDNLQGIAMNTEKSLGNLTTEEKKILQIVQQERNFYVHLGKYALTITLLTIINIITSPYYLWVLWVASGWGIGLICHAVVLFSPWKWFGDEWERKTVEKRIGRKL